MDIKELRKSKEMTQAAFAAAIGVTGSTITAVETGRRKLNEGLIAKVKEVFGVDVDAEVAPKKPASRRTARKKAASAGRELIIQSPMGGEITPDEIFAKVGRVDIVYVRVDENKAYWVKGKKSGSVELW
ncbi:MAG: helix-turn-helix transcriptional regulator [Fretibacterium sp.]|nr:helix-turn-helix transcriptional regulator [Fretibacterium sp.]